MNALTRPLRGEEAAVLLVHFRAMEAGHSALSLGTVEKRMGPKGRRSPAAEAHAFLCEQGLLEQGVDRVGNVTPGKWVISPSGERVIGVAVRDARQELAGRIERARRENQAAAEVERLQLLLDMLPADMAADMPHEEPEEEREEEEEEADEKPAPRRTAKARGKLPPRRGPASGAGPVSKPTTPADPVAGVRRGAPPAAAATAPPRRNR
jgi:hypothetical protein